MKNRVQELEGIIAQAKEELIILRRSAEPQRIEDLIGKYFKYDNGYNSTERWWLYLHIRNVEGSKAFCMRFEITSRGEYHAEFHDTRTVSFFDDDNSVEISMDEYKAAWQSYVSSIAVNGNL